MKRRLVCLGSGVAAVAFAASAWASNYSDAVLALDPNEYLCLDDTSGIGIDSSAAALHPLKTIEAGVTRGAPGPRPADGFAGMGTANLAYSFPNNTPPDNSSTGAQTDSETPSTPQPSDGYIPASGSAPRTIIAWFRLTQRPGIEGDPNNDPSSRQGPIGFLQYGRSSSGNNVGNEFRFGVTTEVDSHGNRTGRDLFDVNVGARHIQAANTAIAQQTWYMAAVVCPNGFSTAGNMHVFVDGQLQTLQGDTLQTINTASGTQPTSFRIGRDFSGYGIGGQVDEVSVWERALSDSDILNLYDTALGIVNTTSTWNVDSDGNWTNAGNWQGDVPNGKGASAIFGSVIGAPRTVTLDAPQTVGQLKFDNTNGYIVAGTSTLTIDNASANGAVNNVTGSHTVSAPIALAVSTDITVAQASDTLTLSGGVSGAAGIGLNKLGPGTLELKNIRANSLAINAGKVHILQDGTSDGASKISALTLAGGTGAWTSTLDLDDNYLVVEYSGASPLATIANQVKSGRAGGSWTGTGINSSTAAAIAALPNFKNKTAVGYAEAAALGISSFGGQSVEGNAVLLRYAIMGDANLDGTVNTADFTRMANAFNGTGQYWFNGDFNSDGVVNALDFNALALNFGLSLSPPFPGSVVPEPASLVALGVCGLTFFSRRSRK